METAIAESWQGQGSCWKWSLKDSSQAKEAQEHLETPSTAEGPNESRWTCRQRSLKIYHAYLIPTQWACQLKRGKDHVLCLSEWVEFISLLLHPWYRSESNNHLPWDDVGVRTCISSRQILKVQNPQLQETRIGPNRV